jgi:hypothetical protein
MPELECLLLAEVAKEAVAEAERATLLYPPFNSEHEGFAVLKEEVDELWDEVKKSPRKRDPAKLRVEAVQVAAMALRFLVDRCGWPPNLASPDPVDGDQVDALADSPDSY